MPPGRPRKFTDEDVKRLYRTASTTAELSASLGVTPTMMYRHLKRLGLEPKTLGGRMDLRKFTDEDFKKCVESGMSVQDIAHKFGATPQTIRTHMKRFGFILNGKFRVTDALAIQMMNEYTGQVTMMDLANKHLANQGTVRNALSRAISLIWSPKAKVREMLPIPTSIPQLKVYNALRKMPGILQTPVDKVAEALGVPQRQIVEYLDRVPQPKQKK